MTGSVLITGAGGELGGRVAQELAGRGLTVVGMGRRARPAGWRHDWIAGDVADRGVLRPATGGVRTIVHCATDPACPARDLEMLRNAIAVSAEGQLYLLHVGIAGIEGAIGSPYYASKLEGERLLQGSRLAHGLVRSTQFHPFILSILRKLELWPVLLCPAIEFQPVDPDYVAKMVGRCVDERAPVAMTLSGPERLKLRDLAGSWLRHRRAIRLRLPVPAFGPLRPMAAIMPVDGSSGGRTWAQWIDGGPGDGSARSD